MLFLLVAAAPALLPPQQRTPPEFHAGVRLIRLDVSVVDGSGRPVAGLGPGDFQVFEDHRPVELTYFEAVEAGGVEPAAAAGGEGSRRVLLLVDTAAMTPGQLRRAREGAARFLRERAADGDWVRLVNLSTGQAWDGRIPESRLRLVAAARALARRGSPWIGPTEGIEDRREAPAGADSPSSSETSGRFLSLFAQGAGLLGTLESLLVELGGVAGRKALVLVSPGFPQLVDLDRRLQRVASLARESATAVYFVDVVGLDGLTPEPGQALVSPFESAWARSGGAQDLAEATGGFVARFANSLLPALARVGAEMRTYYVLGYAPSRPDDGRFRSVKVKVGVAGLEARTKKGYLAGPRR